VDAILRSLRRFKVYAAVLCCVAILNLVPLVSVAEPAVEDFAWLPTFTALEISPGGKYLAARMNRENIYRVVIIDISNKGFRKLYEFAETDELSAAWFRWVSSTHLLMSVSFKGVRGHSLSGVKTEERRLLGVDVTTAEPIELFDNRRPSPVQIQDRVVSFLPNDPKHVLVQYSLDDPSRPHVYRVDVTKRANHKRVLRGRIGVLFWMADRRARVRLGQGVKDNKSPLLIALPDGGKKWLDLSHRVDAPGVVFDPIAFAADPNDLYIVSNHEGGPTGLYLFDIVEDRFTDKIFRHANSDLSRVKIDDKSGELISITFDDENIDTIYFSKRPIDEALLDVRAQLQGNRFTRHSISSDGNHAVFKVRTANDPGTYFLYDNTEPLIRQLPFQYPGLPDQTLGETIVSSYVARDGLEIPAFVTLPHGLSDLDAAEQLPFVILPHGGPGARDFMRFDYWAQFLVSNGYGVLQMNFRGSTGYGQAFKAAGHREWGQAMQDDITDGVRWLIEGGHADADRIAIMGGSYGGYAALMGVVKTPELFQCAISFAGVSDLRRLIRLARKFIAGAYATRFIGDLWKDRNMLRANSPVSGAKEITVPVLLVHGDIDVVVDIDQSRDMAKELKKHDKEFEFIVLEGGDHYLSLYRNRLHFLTASERFLSDCLN